MKIIKKIDFKCFEINIEYKEQLITIKAEPYKTIEYIKEKSKNKFMDLPSDIRYYYLGKDITECGSEKIGDYFKNREKVTIKLIPSNNYHHNNNSPSSINIINKKNNYNNLLKYSSQKDLLSESTINKNMKEIKIIKLIGEQNKQNNNDEINKNKLHKSYTKLPRLQKVILNNNLIKNKIIPNKTIKDMKIKDIEWLCNCGKHNISQYCRNCKKFICLECRSEQKHKNHLTIRLNLHNVEENVKNYGKLIQDDILDKIEMNKNIFSNSDILEDNILINRKERIIHKYGEVIKIYQKIMSGINNKLKAEDKERSSLVINAYNDLSQRMNRQLLELLDKLNNNYIKCNRKIMFNDLRSFFDEINSKEETLTFLGKDIIKYHLKHEINTKLKSSLDKIDRALEEINDEKNPFDLDNKYYEELVKMDIIKQAKINKEKELNNNESTKTNLIKIDDSFNMSMPMEEKDINNNQNKIGLSKFANIK